MEILGGVLKRNDTNQNAMGGTEIIATKIAELLQHHPQIDKFQIIFSRARGLAPDKIRIFCAHDLADDPESAILNDGGWKQFNRIIFVSNWQMQEYIKKFNIPWSHCFVIPNGIEPIPTHKKPEDKIVLGYWSTPHRGLELLVPVFEELQKKHENLELHTYSNFNLYGWPERNEQYKGLFDRMEANPSIKNFGTVPNEVLRKGLEDIHIFAYPSIWPETSCLCLMEAMSAGCVCVHSNYAALPETASKFTSMYQFHEDPAKHMEICYVCLDHIIENIHHPVMSQRTVVQKGYIDTFHRWEGINNTWNALLTTLSEAAIIPLAQEMFTYRT